MQFSTRRVEGFALSDGEQVERLWSYMRNFCRSTKEMTASNRVDAITDALLYYSKKAMYRMGKFQERSAYKFVGRQCISSVWSGGVGFPL